MVRRPPFLDENGIPTIVEVIRRSLSNLSCRRNKGCFLFEPSIGLWRGLGPIPCQRTSPSSLDIRLKGYYSYQIDR